MKKFGLSHTVLYSKGWYCKTDDVFEDLIKILRLDDYTPFNKSNVFTILTREYSDYMEGREGYLADFLTDLSPSNSFMYGYLTKQSRYASLYMSSVGDLDDWDYHTAVVHKILHHLKFMDVSNTTIKIPRYSKENPRPGSVSLKDVIEQFKGKGTSVIKDKG